MLSFLLLDFFQILAFSIILYKYPLKDRLDHYLTIILIGGGAAMLSKVVYFCIFDTTENLQSTISSTLCFIAISHLFIREFLSKEQIGNTVISLHLIPFFLSIVFFFFELFSPYLSSSTVEVVYEVFNPVAQEIRTISLVVYLLLDLIVLWRFRTELVRQIYTINGGILVYFVAHKAFILSLILLSSANIGPKNLVLHVGLLSMPLLLAVVVYYKVLVGIRRKIKEFDQRIGQFLSDKAARKGPKYAKSNPDDEKHDQLAEAVTAFMEREKPYLDMAFSMAQFAQCLQISQHELSLVINHRLHTTFYEYINKHRIAHFMSHIHKVVQEDMTVLTLAYACGFSSKSTFNKYFRQLVGMSPTEYVKQYVSEQDNLPLVIK